MRPYKCRGGGWRRHGTPGPPPCPAGRPRLTFFPFRGERRNGTGLLTAPHPVGAAISRPRAHTMRPYKRGVWGRRRHGTPAPPPCTAGRHRLIFFPLRGGCRNGTGHLSCPASRRGGYQPPAGACYAPLQTWGGLTAARHTDTAPLSGRASPSYFLPPSWGMPERDRPSQLTRIP